jgi:uncharacterized protein YkwD
MYKHLHFLAFFSCLLTFGSSVWTDYGNNSEIDASNQQCVDEFRQAALELHNEFRTVHNAPYLREFNNLDNGAQNYAEYLAANEIFEHSNARGLGENLYMSYGMANTCAGEL